MDATTGPDNGTSTMDVDSVPLARPHYAPPGSPSATTAYGVAHAAPQPPLRSATTGNHLLLFLPPPPLPPQPTIDAWARARCPSPEPLLVAGHDPLQVTAMHDELKRKDTFNDFIALATRSELGRLVAAQMTALDFLAGSGDAAPRDIPSIDDLWRVAPRVTKLSINLPFGPPFNPFAQPQALPQIQQLFIVQENRAIWSPNQTAGTLEALRARQIRSISIRNASLATLAPCMAYLRDISDCVLIDYNDRRYIQFIDQYRTHTYDGAFIGLTRSIFTHPILGNVISLTLNAYMLPNELDLLFRVAFPYGLKRLHLWYSTQERSPTVRSELLAYRRAGNGHCNALELLSLTTARPLAANVGPLDQATLPVARSLLDAFLTHIHGREVLVEDDVPLELQGMAVWPAARDRGSDAPGDTAVNDAGGGALVVLEN